MEEYENALSVGEVGCWQICSFGHRTVNVAFSLEKIMEINGLTYLDKLF